MKGITPVIAIVLLLMITISMVGFAFIWFSRMMETTTNQTTASTQQQMSQMSKTIRIDNAPAGGSIDVRNTGSSSIAVSELSVYINNAAPTCNWGGTTTLAPGATASCTPNPACTAGQSVKVVAPGNTDIVTC
jgi:flagellin-like protein